MEGEEEKGRMCVILYDLKKSAKRIIEGHFLDLQ